MKNKLDVQPVLLCGGSGTRLWPLSRAGFPKQFLCITEEADSLFQQATRRLMGIGSENVRVIDPIVSTGEDHRFLVTEQLREIGLAPTAIILEPVSKSTAPALTLAALAAVENGDDPVLVVVSADQNVANTEMFNVAIHSAICKAAEGSIVILGVTPDRPETGYGYIRTLDVPMPSSTLLVEQFIEKPDEATARQYLADGGYYWNAGIFVLRASIWLRAIEKFRPATATLTRNAWAGRSVDALFVRPSKTEFTDIQSESIDYAVIERCPGSEFSILMTTLDADWSDLGIWDAVWSILSKDPNGNAHVGDILSTGCRNTLAYATSRLVTLVGVQNLVVVETPDAVLVTDRMHSQNVKEIVQILQQQKREERTLHRKVQRPWGWYDTVDESGSFKVKRIQVKPGASLSLQKHNYRAEHWVVVRGTAKIICGEKNFLLTENQSTYIPQGEVHRLSNPDSVPLEIIEVQSGSYLGEDDIVRYEDSYGRS